MQGWPIFLAAIAYVTLLFIVASVGDRNARRTSATTPRPYIYALSLAIYCTSWTFFGSVGLASEHGFDFLSIYIGPIIIFVFGFPLLKRLMVRQIVTQEKILDEISKPEYIERQNAADVAEILRTAMNGTARLVEAAERAFVAHQAALTAPKGQVITQ